MRLSTVSAAIGLAFLSASLLFIQSSASYSAHQPAIADGSPAGQVVIPAAALPPFNPAETRITETEGTLIVRLEAGDSRQDLHLLPRHADRAVTSVQVYHANHGPLMTLRLDDGCSDDIRASRQDRKDRAAESTQDRRLKKGCGRYAA